MPLKPLLTAGLALLATTAITAQPGFGRPQPIVKGQPIEGSSQLSFPVKGAESAKPARLGERNPLLPPFVETFDNYPEGSEHANFERYFEVINSNGDTNPSGSDRTWGFYNFSGESNGREYSRCAYLQYPLNKAACDDWLLPRAIKLEGGKYYRVTVDASLYNAGTTHRFEVRMGEYNDAEGLSTTVIKPVDVTTIVPTQHEGWFVPEFDGIYYMGIHGLSIKSQCEGGYLFMDNIGIEAARSGREPSRITELEFVSDPNGTPSVEIRFKAPGTAIDGSALSGKLTIEVKRDGKTVKTLTADPGQALAVNDAVDEASLQTYSITVSNSAGNGCETRVSHFVGMSNPLPPVFTSITESAVGTITMKWAPPATDVNGTAINPEKITYNIYEVTVNGLELCRADYAATELTLDLGIDPGTQEVLTFAIAAIVNDEISDVTVSDVVFAGTPYELPYRNSFEDNNSADVVLSTTADENVNWRMLDDFSDPRAQDGDGGYVGMIGNAPNQYGELSTGKIDFSSATDANISFYTYVYPEDENEVSVFMVDCETGERTLAGKMTLTEFNGVGWRRIVLPLSGCAGKIMRVVIGARILTHGNVLFDNMVVDKTHDIDLAVTDIAHSRHATAGEKYTVTATVTNYGARTVESFATTLYCQGAAVVTETAGPLAPAQSAKVTLNGEFSAVSPEMPEFRVRVDADGDGNLADNVSEAFNITFLAPIHPVVETLEGVEADDGTVSLTWSAPDLSNAAPAESIEDFESYPAFTTELNGFTMYDADGGFPAGLVDVDMPVTSSHQAYWTMTSAAPFGFISTIGTSSLVTMATVNSSGSAIANDDWLISPELYGGRQTINFFVCSQTVDYGYETFEVYASSTDTDIRSFRKVLYETEVGLDWENVFVTLPAGTKYFAIRCTSNDCMFFTIDNITYIAKGTPRDLRLVGYNVYRNGECLTDSPITETRFTTSRNLEGDDYFVTAVYEQGESTASNIVHFGVVGIDDTTAVENVATPAEYFDLRGMRVAADRLTPGIYIRRQGQKVDKVIIR